MRSQQFVFTAGLLLLFMLAVGCAKMPLRGDYIKDTPPQITADADSAVIYFVREGAFGGGGISYFIFEDTQKIGLLKSGTYFMHRATPGKHTYLAKTESRAAVTLDVKAGETYYIEGTVGMGFWAGRPELREITKAVAEQYLPELEYVRLATPEEQEAYKLKEASQNTGQSL
ncbi:MAG: DUF2846 domain-containing protein [Desulfovibrio sp.]|nr:DUF2846 domain-containing protein [Desulfovibrio sp.]